jgi:hypothetical protein
MFGSATEVCNTPGKGGVQEKLAASGEIISVRTNVVEELERIFVKQRLEVVDKDGFLITPLHIMKQLAEEYNQKIHSEVYVLQHGTMGFVDYVYRVEIFCGQARGNFLYIFIIYIKIKSKYF